MTEPLLLLQPQPLLHDPEWAAQAMQAGPNGARFDTAAHLLAAASLPQGVVAMYDSTDTWALPAGAAAYAGYFNGRYANMDQLRARFPGAQFVSYTPDGARGAMYIDIEPGNADASAVPAFVKAGGLGFYASPGAAGKYSARACLDACAAAGIPRSKLRYNSAHWIGRHICSPSTCGYPQADGTQYVSTAGWDESAVNSPAFFTPPPPDPAVPQRWGGDGRTSLAAAAALAPGQTPASVLSGTAAKLGWNTALAGFVNGVFGGSLPPSAPVPGDAVLWLLAPPAPPSPSPSPEPAPVPLPGWLLALYARLPAVRQGSQDQAGGVPWVRQVQLLLRAAGILTVTADGDFGPDTGAGLELFQEQAGLLKTGWADPVTWEVLLAGKPGAVLPVVAEGHPDAAVVRRVQALCAAHGQLLAMDGVFAAGTRTAVQSVQKTYYPDNTAVQDGVVGPVTWSLLAAHAVP